MTEQRRRDAVDRLVQQWNEVRPDIDISPVEVIGRVSRLSRFIDRRLGENFAEHGIDDWMYDVMATLYRAGSPHELTAGDLVGQTMVTTGAITNRIDRLEGRGYVERAKAEDRRKVIVRLTTEGVAAVESIVDSHIGTEDEILAALSRRDRADLARMLRTLLVDLGDIAPEP